MLLKRGFNASAKDIESCYSVQSTQADLNQTVLFFVFLRFKGPVLARSRSTSRLSSMLDKTGFYESAIISIQSRAKFLRVYSTHLLKTL